MTFVGRGIPDAPPQAVQPHQPQHTPMTFVGRGIPDAPPQAAQPHQPQHKTPHPTTTEKTP